MYKRQGSGSEIKLKKNYISNDFVPRRNNVLLFETPHEPEKYSRRGSYRCIENLESNDVVLSHITNVYVIELLNYEIYVSRNWSI